MAMQFHHVALSVRNTEISQAFYEKLGFREVYRWQADDASMTIVQLKLGGVLLELMARTSNREAQPLQDSNNYDQIGLKHLGLAVEDIQATFENMKTEGYELRDPAVKHGRTGIDYFFIKDPDGLWVEIVQDKCGY
jgi:catechol 2,3-dioxygenase-like lactoylglutathione lyase family enzyme